MMSPGLLLLSLAVLVLGSGAFQIQPMVNDTKNDEWVWVSLPDDQNICSVFFYTEHCENEDPAFNYRVDPNVGHPWAVKEYLNDTLRVSVVVETYQCEIISESFKITPRGGTRNSGLKPVRKYTIGTRRPSDCEALKHPQRFCIPTDSVFNGQACECGGRMIFSETFENESWRNNWQHMEHSQLPNPYYESVAFVHNGINSYVKDSALHLRVTPSKYSRANPFYLKNCTWSTKEKVYCGYSKYKIQSKKYWPPFNSASINSMSDFTYCRIEIEAKLPIGDWLFPVLSLKSKINSASIRIAIVRGNKQLKDIAGNEIGGKSLFGGAIVDMNRHEAMRHVSVGKHFGEDFHTYSAIWKKNIIIFKVDGRPYAEITDTDILNELSEGKCHIQLGLTVGGEYNFPDSRIFPDQKPFRNNINGGIRNLYLHNFDSELVIRSLRVYSITDYEQ
ncbi:gram-negative bacteria-binding protein 2 [Drosophila miranda]|uniref:gram-negative bacteria-binding protein 2 n=1 Tax=Drosophila miranda TaxID=7229 RepID=UPI0007E7BC40|nr:gram-negative bacteria-binding protein 2 [Drosophila miranda]